MEFLRISASLDDKHLIANQNRCFRCYTRVQCVPLPACHASTSAVRSRKAPGFRRMRGCASTGSNRPCKCCATLTHRSCRSQRRLAMRPKPIRSGVQEADRRKPKQLATTHQVNRRGARALDALFRQQLTDLLATRLLVAHASSPTTSLGYASQTAFAAAFRRLHRTELAAQRNSTRALALILRLQDSPRKSRGFNPK